MDIDQLIGKFYNRLKKADIAGTEGKVAVQFNLTGKITGVFYIEILNGNVSVMPYEYIDHDAIVSGSMTNLEKMLTGKLVPQVAIAEGKIKVEGPPYFQAGLLCKSSRSGTCCSYTRRNAQK